MEWEGALLWLCLALWSEGSLWQDQLSIHAPEKQQDDDDVNNDDNHNIFVASVFKMLATPVTAE